MKHISFNNFRAFREQCDFEFAPITILTGTNSSGKSSLTDGLRIFSNYFKRLREKASSTKPTIWNNIDHISFRDLIDRVPGFKALVNRSSHDGSFTISFRYKVAKLTDELSVEMTFSDLTDDPGRLTKLIFSSLNRMKSGLEGRHVAEFKYRGDNKYLVTINFDYFWECFKEEVEKQKEFFSIIRSDYNEEKPDDYDGWYCNEELLHRLEKVHPNLLYNCLLTTGLYEDVDFGEVEYGTLPLFNARLGDNYQIFDVDSISQFLDIDLSKAFYRYTTEDGRDDSFRFVDSERNWLKGIFEQGLVGNLEEVISVFRNPLSWLLYGRQYTTRTDFEESDFLSLFADKFHLVSLYRNKSTLYTPHQNINVDTGAFFLTDYIWGSLEAAITGAFPDFFYYIPSIRNVPKRFYLKGSETFFDELLLDLANVPQIKSTESPNDNRIKEFLQYAIRHFEIGDDITIEMNADLGFKLVHIVKDGQQINPLDLGFGFSQLLPIILQIAKIATENHVDYLLSFKKSTLIIEEPETNLHPALQSRLAEIIILAYKRLNIHTIVETHSEYLIRKLQYLTAHSIDDTRKLNDVDSEVISHQKALEYAKEGKFRVKFNTDVSLIPSDTVIYYFYHPDKIPTGEKQVKKINIMEDGSLTGDFGTGFFDEAGNIALSLWSMTNSKRN